MAGYPSLARRGFLMPNRMKASYDGAGTGRRSTAWQSTDTGPTSASLGGLQRLRNRSRAATRNDPYGFSAIDRLVSNTIGTGITPKPKHKDDVIRAALQELWDDWTEEADADGRADFYGLQALICRAVYESGECFVRLRPRRPDDGLAVPFQLQILEPEFVPHDKHGRHTNGNVIRAGIEFNGIGQRVAYWMYRVHPSETMQSATGYNEPVQVPADQILHIFEPLRPGQLRGIPILAPVLARLKSLDDFDDAVLFRQEVANLFAGFIRKPAPEDAPVDPITGAPFEHDTDGFTPMVGLEPGTMQELQPGEEIEFSSPPDAGNTYPDFMRQQLLAAAAGAGLPYELLTGDLREVNDRVIRVVLNEFRRRIEQRQFGVFVHQLCRPVRVWWLDMAVLSGAIDLPDYQRQRRAYLRTRWVPQGWAYIHPVQDVQARRMEVRAGFTSRAEVALRQGYDSEMIDAENAADNARADSLGLSYDSDAREKTSVDQTKQAQAQESRAKAEASLIDAQIRAVNLRAEDEQKRAEADAAHTLAKAKLALADASLKSAQADEATAQARAAVARVELEAAESTGRMADSDARRALAENESAERIAALREQAEQARLESCAKVEAMAEAEAFAREQRELVLSAERNRAECARLEVDAAKLGLSELRGE